MLLHHAQFICDQILSFDNSAKDQDQLLITAPCIRDLINLARMTFNKGGQTMRKRRKRNNTRQQEDDRRKGLIRGAQKGKKATWTKATTTQLVNNVFKSFFPDQLANSKDSMTIKRRCPNMEIQEANDQDPDDQDAETSVNAVPSMQAHKKNLDSLKSQTGIIKWLDRPIIVDNHGEFHQAVQLDSKVIKVNDYVFIESVNPTVPLQIVKIISMWENKMAIKMFHGTWLWRGSETVLGETCSSSELFLVDDCRDISITYIKSKTRVVHRAIPDNWENLGNADSSINDSKEDTTSFYYQKRYDPDTARFEDPLPEVESTADPKYHFCAACKRSTEKSNYNKPQVYENSVEKGSKEVLIGMIKFRGEEFRAGNAVYLQPKTFQFKNPPVYQNLVRIPEQQVDEDRFPEYYRKFNDRIKGSNFDTPEPFDIGYITSIYATTSVEQLVSAKSHIRVKKMYRPENTHKSERSDVNLIYWSEEEVSVPFASVVGKCYLAYSENIVDIEAWSNAGPNRFYFTEMYTEEKFGYPPPKACIIGKVAKSSDKLKLESKSIVQPVETAPEHAPFLQKLRTLDVFAGCGGLSEGLKQAGVCESKWAIEIDRAAAHAYRLNNPDAIVFTRDCNALLRRVMDGKTVMGGQHLPQKGEVDLLCGGPPCQGFSSMNRFDSRAYSLFKNSLVVSYLSYCDFYRPRFFIMENVRNFVTFKKSLVLKLTLRCLLQMGYQCTFGIVQAGNFGVPQTRRRMILLAAAPGETLPKYPNPLHVFSKSACNLNVIIDEKKYFPACHDWTDSAPYRVTTVKDALSDLPSIKSGKSDVIMSYDSEPTSHFQKKIRSGIEDNVLLDHLCKEFGALIEARMAKIPTASGSDWRNLPNIAFLLNNGTRCNILKYLHHDGKAGTSSTGALRGVCRCASGKLCDPRDRQVNTLIPWCLPHTANRHNNWAGLYGRIEWDGFFSTIITNPEPMGKQGRVLHPDQNRVVSVRECARSQGFLDSFRFYGNIKDKHRQVGNAVPPPLARAIGLEIRKCLNESKFLKMEN